MARILRGFVIRGRNEAEFAAAGIDGEACRIRTADNVVGDRVATVGVGRIHSRDGRGVFRNVDRGGVFATIAVDDRCVVDVADQDRKVVVCAAAIAVICGNTDGNGSRVFIARRAAEGAGVGVERQPVRQGIAIGKGRGVGQDVAILVCEGGAGKGVEERIVFRRHLVDQRAVGDRLVIDVTNRDGYRLRIRQHAVRHLHRDVVDVVPTTVSWRFEIRRIDKSQVARAGIDGKQRCIGTARDGVGEVAAVLAGGCFYGGDGIGVFIDNDGCVGSAAVAGDGRRLRNICHKDGSGRLVVGNVITVGEIAIDVVDCLDGEGTGIRTCANARRLPV